VAAARTDDEKFDLAAWCTANRLAACDEFLWRDLLRLYWHSPGHPAYEKALALWLAAAPKHASPFVFDLPVRGEWYVERDDTGNNRRKHGAAFARNLSILRNGRAYAGSPGDAASYFAWNQPFYAIADGRIAKADDRHPDPPAGKAVGVDDANYITQDCGGGVFAYYGHIKSGSAEVRPGQAVRTGQALGRVGNSGSHGLPHLHFILMDADYFSVPGRYRFEQLAGNRWAPRDGAELAEDSFIRPPAAARQPVPAPAARPGKPLPPRKAP
jgi:murein DD-endopeptidase MepM/ murein hydrolase activator NlpD